MKLESAILFHEIQKLFGGCEILTFYIVYNLQK